MICNSPVFDKEMFRSIWKPLISAITFAFMTFDDDYVIERAIAGFRQCATLAGYFQLPEVFDFVVISLSQATGLLSENLPFEVPMYPVVEVEGQSITVSSLAVSFGAHLKGQLAAVVLFNIMNGNGNAIREGWIQVRPFDFSMFDYGSRFAGFRDLVGFIRSLFTPHSNAPDGGFPWWRFYDTVARKQ